MKSKPKPEKKIGFEIKIQPINNEKGEGEGEGEGEVFKPDKQIVIIKDFRKEVVFDRSFVLEKLKNKGEIVTPLHNNANEQRNKKVVGESFRTFEKIGPKKLTQKIIIGENESLQIEPGDKEPDEEPGDKEPGKEPGDKEPGEEPVDKEPGEEPGEEPVVKEPGIEEPKPAKIVKLRIKKIKPTLEEPTTALEPTQINIFPSLEKQQQNPNPEKHIVRVSPYYMNNRKLFIENMSQLFKPYKEELLKGEEKISCVREENEEFKLLTHQKVVRDYLNLYTPYRGLLLYHGLGAGKTNSSIAIAEGMKSEKKIILMTPAALKANFFVELKKYGDPLFRKNQFWEKVSIEGRPEFVDVLSKVLSLSPEFIKKEGGAWLFDISKPANFKTLSKEEQMSIDVQLDKMIRAKYTDINYNGLNRRIIDELTQNSTINPFDHSVVIIDEAHNFVSLIVNQIEKTKSIPVTLYDLLLKAVDCRVVLLSGTPIINYPNEIGILYNILRGYIKTWTFPLSVTTQQKITQETILKMFHDARFKTYDYIEYSGNQLKITRNPFGFINHEKREYVRQQKGGFFDSLFSGGNKKKSLKKKTNLQTNKTNSQTKKKITKLPGYTIKDGILHIHSFSEKEIGFSENDLQPDEKINDGIAINYYEGGAGDEQYNGVNLDETGNLSDADFVKKVKKILANNGLEVERMHTDNYKALPDDSTSFLNLFIDPDQIILKNENLFKKRILGLTSYFRSAQEQLLPRILKSDTGENYKIIRVPMSEYQFGIYVKIRKQEYESEKKRKKKKNNNAEDLYKVASSYRIFSRACCNFAFPSPPGRPMPGKKAASQEEKNLDENEFDAISVDQETGQETEQNDSQEYEKRIQAAMEMLKYIPEKEDSEEQYLTPPGLQKYSPKFLKILENIKNPENRGLHLLYSQFRSIEGIGILKLVLDANGFARFRIEKNNTTNEWEIKENESEVGKPKYVLYTGTETKEEKAILLNIYNNNWFEENISENLRRQLESISSNNFYGEIIKVFMITSSGAEGINLKNTRFVHITEPYWHLVRTEQVIGRARRICSHYDLPEELRTVQVFLYLSVFSEYQKTDKQNIELMIRDLSRIDKRPVTTDESLYDISLIKNNINSQILKAIKESAVDCRLYSNTNKDENLVCYGFGKIHSNDFSSYPSLEQDTNEKDEINVEKKTTGLVETKPINGIQYAIDKKTNILYDLESFKQGEKIQVGKLEKDGNQYRVVLLG
jgi:hypothetical protein